MRARLTSVGSSHASSPMASPPSWAPLPWSQASYGCQPLGNSVCSDCLCSVCSGCCYIVSGGENSVHSYIIYGILCMGHLSPSFSAFSTTTLPPLSYSPLPLFSLHSSASSSSLSSTFFCCLTSPLYSLSLSYSTTLLTGKFWRSFSILTWPQ